MSSFTGPQRKNRKISTGTCAKRNRPHWHDTSSCKEYKKLLELICKNEEKLRAAMTDEQKELFEKYTDCVREYQTIADCLLFQNSFKLGARMMVEVMED